jgi:2-oxo-3-hexenedioate decarboxylase
MPRAFVRASMQAVVANALESCGIARSAAAPTAAIVAGTRLPQESFVPPSKLADQPATPAGKPLPPGPERLRPIADELMLAMAQRRQISPHTSRPGGLTLADSYLVADEVRERRRLRGEVPVGRKIGFTNRQIWAEYDVWAPIWGTVYSSTLHLVSDRPNEAAACFDVAHLREPRIEPEIVFGLGQAPRAGMSADELMDCIAWVAHGFELVQSLYPGWKFAAADTVAAFGLHGALWLGPRTEWPTDAVARSGWQHALEHFEIDLLCDGVVADRGQASHVLDGPLHALRHLVDLLGDEPAAPALQAGELVSTGTLTRALPVQSGQTWSTRLYGLDLPGLRLTMA